MDIVAIAKNIEEKTPFKNGIPRWGWLQWFKK
jgi:hypothetical protein